jgi:2-iminobutanoate/2-iminopropanoate deaminase
MAKGSRISHKPEGVGEIDAPYSLVVSSGDLVFVSGQVPIDEHGQPTGGDFEEQMRVVMENIRRCLEAAGCGFDHVIKLNCFIGDYEDYAEYNRLYREYFEPPYPARTTVKAELLGFGLEIDAIARRPADKQDAR